MLGLECAFYETLADPKGNSNPSEVDPGSTEHEPEDFEHYKRQAKLYGLYVSPSATKHSLKLKLEWYHAYQVKKLARLTADYMDLASFQRDGGAPNSFQGSGDIDGDPLPYDPDELDGAPLPEREEDLDGIPIGDFDS